MTYAEHQQEDYARQTAEKWRCVNTVTFPFTSVIILGMLILLVVLARVQIPLLIMKICIVSLAVAGVGLFSLTLFLELLYWRCPACGHGMMYVPRDQPKNVNPHYPWPQYCDCGARLR